MVGDPSLVREMLTNETEMGSWGAERKKGEKREGRGGKREKEESKQAV